jgi:flavin-dependent dehydrogenase
MPLGVLADSNPHHRVAKVAVVGSGLAGLTAAYLLSTLPQRGDIRHNGRPVEYEVHVFEKVCARFPLPTSGERLLIVSLS